MHYGPGTSELDMLCANHPWLKEHLDNLNACIIKAETDLAAERRESENRRLEAAEYLRIAEKATVNEEVALHMVNTQQDRLDHVMPLLRGYAAELKKAVEEAKKIGEQRDKAESALRTHCNRYNELVEENERLQADLKIVTDERDGYMEELLACQKATNTAWTEQL